MRESIWKLLGSSHLVPSMRMCKKLERDERTRVGVVVWELQAAGSRIVVDIGVCCVFVGVKDDEEGV